MHLIAFIPRNDNMLNPLSTRFIQRDVDLTLLGFKPFQIPFSDTPIIIEPDGSTLYFKTNALFKPVTTIS